MASNWEEFYSAQLPPSDLKESENLLEEFYSRHCSGNTRVVLVTSGGTTVPLEHNTVRFVDNFSAGTRGSISAEYFLENGYAVVFMYRVKSLQPFSRHFTGQKFLNMLDLNESNNGTTITVKPDNTQKISEVLRKYKAALSDGKLLELSFTTLSEYLWLLRSACRTLAPLRERCTLYLAAAVSDFYIPPDEMSVHKIPSSKPQTISLQLVPKILAPLVSLWVPNAFVVSFKLETDKNLLIVKARDALNKYKHKLVIANTLHDRRQQVTLVTQDNSFAINLTKEQLDAGEEIEMYIVREIIKKHEAFIEERGNKS